MAKPTEQEITANNVQAEAQQAAVKEMMKDLEFAAGPGALSREDSLGVKLMTRSPIATALCQAIICIPLGVCALYFGTDGMKANYSLSSISQDLVDMGYTENDINDIPDSLTADNTLVEPEYEDTYCYDVGLFLTVSGAVCFFGLLISIIQYKVVSDAGAAAFDPKSVSSGGLGLGCCLYCLYSLASLFSTAWWIYGMILLFGDYKDEQSVCEDVFDHKEMILYAKIHLLLPICLGGGICVLFCCAAICGGGAIAMMGK